MSPPLPPINLEYNNHAVPFPDSDEELALIDTMLDQPLAEVFPELGSDRGLQEMLAHFESNWGKTPLHLLLVLKPCATDNLGRWLADVVKCIVCREIMPKSLKLKNFAMANEIESCTNIICMVLCLLWLLCGFYLLASHQDVQQLSNRTVLNSTL